CEIRRGSCKGGIGREGSGLLRGLTVQIAEIAFIGYPVTDVERARGVYGGLLGLSPPRTFSGDDRLWIEYDLGPTTFAISNVATDKWKPSPDGPNVAFEVVDFDVAI